MNSFVIVSYLWKFQSSVIRKLNRRSWFEKKTATTCFCLFQLTVFALAVVANCEAPGGYSYNRQSGGGSSAGGQSFGGGGGGGYQQEAVGGSTNEGQSVDPQLLDQIRQILLREESQNGGGSSGGGAAPSSSYGAPQQPSSQYGAPQQPSSSYGAPQSSYGPPQQSARVVGIVLENTVPAVQVAQYRSQSQSAGGYASGPSQSYGAPAPSSSYGAPSRPSSSYGAPF